ncbi:MAG: hypothetical protein IKM32_02040 [Clostridia bacterium]|nr:hypothetical protein [Clostridia bacterium]
MTKNVIVVDEQGNEYGATYSKRARGLVKNGRARFIDENKICLACPPKEFLEDKMNENINNQTTEATQATETQSASNYTMDYCLAQIAKIQSETAYFNGVLTELSKVRPEDFAAAERARAMGDAVRCRETTNQKLLEFYVKMYEDLRNANSVLVADSVSKLTHVGDKVAECCDEDNAFEALSEIAKMIKELTLQAIKA